MWIRRRWVVQNDDIRQTSLQRQMERFNRRLSREGNEGDSNERSSAVGQRLFQHNLHLNETPALVQLERPAGTRTEGTYVGNGQGAFELRWLRVDVGDLRMFLHLRHVFDGVEDFLRVSLGQCLVRQEQLRRTMTSSSGVERTTHFFDGAGLADRLFVVVRWQRNRTKQGDEATETRVQPRGVDGRELDIHLPTRRSTMMETKCDECLSLAWAEKDHPQRCICGRTDRS